MSAFFNKNGNRHAPGALPRHNPIWSIGDHSPNAIFTRRRRPFCAPDLIQRNLSERATFPKRLIHCNEPLGRVAKNDGLF